MIAVQPKPRLLYSLSTRPPIPFPVHPSYPIRLPTRDLPSAYLDSLWTSTQSDQISLESFARLLLSLRAQKPPIELEALLRTLIRPLHDFDKRWRSIIPDLLEEEEEVDSKPENRDGLVENEVDMVFEAYEKWEVVENKRLEEEKAKRKAKGKEKARDQDRMDEDEDERLEIDKEDDEIKAEDWLSQREVYETRMQALLLLTILSLPPMAVLPVPQKKGKGRKKKDLERDSATLDPALLLDFLTDRLQIWRVMQSLSTDDDMDGQERGQSEAVAQRDTVQEWWADIVEPLYRNDVAEDVLAHHRIKLFPDASTDSRTKSQAALYEERSLMSLDKSARRRDLRESQAIISESPTMKRLMSMPPRGEKVPGEEVFKIPLPPSRRNGITSANSLAEDAAGATRRPQEPDTIQSRLPRKQERPRPLPRGDSASANLKDMLKRREVSLTKKASVVGVRKPVTKEGQPTREIGRKRKRKSASPQKLNTFSHSTESLTLVPDTPAKPAAKSASFKKPFSRAISLPSFAALGAAFRPGAPDASSARLPFGVPPPPSLPYDRRTEEDWEMSDTSGADEEDWLESRKADFRAKGGRSRDTSGSTEGDEESQSHMDTPKKPARTFSLKHGTSGDVVAESNGEDRPQPSQETLQPAAVKASSLAASSGSGPLWRSRLVKCLVTRMRKSEGSDDADDASTRQVTKLSISKTRYCSRQRPRPSSR
ncbi:hypothetical protein JCM16303_006177 [Sporobolomyces ruberrimus]